MKIDYTEFDALLKEQIAQGVSKFSQLGDNHALKAMAIKLSGEHIFAFRIFDRRLQALRRRGVIRHDARDGWVVERQ